MAGVARVNAAIWLVDSWRNLSRDIADLQMPITMHNLMCGGIYLSIGSSIANLMPREAVVEHVWINTYDKG